MIDPRFSTLRVFSSTGSVARTAELTGYSPSAVSAQLRELQRSLGIKLIAKEGRGVRLTSAGQQLVAGIDSIVTQWELLAERIDLAVIVASQAPGGGGAKDRFEQTVLLDDPLDVVLPATHPLAQRKSVALEDLADDPWISESGQSVYRALFVAAFTSLGVTPHIAHEAVEWETMIAFIGAGLGVGLLPRLATLGHADDVVRRRISGAAKPSRRIVAVTRKGSRGSPLIEESLEILQRTAERIISQRSAEELDG